MLLCAIRGCIEDEVELHCGPRAVFLHNFDLSTHFINL